MIPAVSDTKRRRVAKHPTPCAPRPRVNGAPPEPPPAAQLSTPGAGALRPALFACALLVSLAAARSTDAGRRVEVWAQFCLVEAPGRMNIWSTTSAAMWAVLPAAAAVAAALVVTAVVCPARRRLALAGLFVMLGACVSTQALKTTLIGLLGAPATLPSGHTTAAVSAAAALVIVCRAGDRPLVHTASGFLASFVSLCVVVARWHTPGDVLAALAVVTLWVCVGHALGLTDRRSVGRAATVGIFAGSATAAITLVGWGSGVATDSPTHALAGTAVRVLLPLGAALVVRFAAGSLPRARRPEQHPPGRLG